MHASGKIISAVYIPSIFYFTYTVISRDIIFIDSQFIIIVCFQIIGFIIIYDSDVSPLIGRHIQHIRLIFFSTQLHLDTFIRSKAYFEYFRSITLSKYSSGTIQIIRFYPQLHSHALSGHVFIKLGRQIIRLSV